MYVILYFSMESYFAFDDWENFMKLAVIQRKYLSIKYFINLFLSVILKRFHYVQMTRSLILRTVSKETHKLIVFIVYNLNIYIHRILNTVFIWLQSTTTPIQKIIDTQNLHIPQVWAKKEYFSYPTESI